MSSRNPYDLIVHAVKKGAVGVLPTDTIYGIVGSALNERTVKKIYRLRKRNLKKPMIILIGSLNDLALFGIAVSPAMKKILNELWPGKVSVILPASKRKYLHRGTGTLAFRLPEPRQLRDFIKKAGPIVAPSANIEGKPPARTISAAKKYFGDKIDFYVDSGPLSSKPSTLVRIGAEGIEVLRRGAVRINAKKS